MYIFIDILLKVSNLNRFAENSLSTLKVPLSTLTIKITSY